MRAAVFQREHFVAFGADEHDGVAGKPDAMRLTAFYFPRPGNGIPVIRVNIDTTQIARRRLRLLGRKFARSDVLLQRYMHVRCLRLRDPARKQTKKVL
jgi:hypothetical protein